MRYAFVLSSFKDLSNTLLYAILKLRSEIFVLEQNIVYLDPDGYDLKSQHLCLMEGEKLIGYARIIPPGVKFEDAAIGRFVVNQNYRNQQLGKLVFRQAIDEVHKAYPGAAITIEGQHQLEQYYISLGFVTIEGPYMLEGLMHVKMRLSTPASA